MWAMGACPDLVRWPEVPMRPTGPSPLQIKMGGEPPAEDEDEDDEYADSWDEEAAAQPSQPAAAGGDEEVEFEEPLEQASQAASGAGPGEAVAED